MDEPKTFTDVAVLPRTLGLRDEAGEARERRDLLVLQAGGRLFGVFADETESVTQWVKPTPLPRAPAAVLGVVGLRGRILTVLDPRAFLNERRARSKETSAPNFIVALRGDEQLALAADRAARIIEIFADAVEPMNRSRTSGVVSGVLQHEGEIIAVLNVALMFVAAMQGAERRRRRAIEKSG